MCVYVHDIAVLIFALLKLLSLRWEVILEASLGPHPLFLLFLSLPFSPDFFFFPFPFFSPDRRVRVEKLPLFVQTFFSFPKTSLSFPRILAPFGLDVVACWCSVSSRRGMRKNQNYSTHIQGFFFFPLIFPYSHFQPHTHIQRESTI